MPKTAPLKSSKQQGPAPKLTPMMAQYFDVKERADDALLFYRMGDFYELFFDDAVQAAAALDITLTKRGQHNGDDIPMCGVPFHAYESYLAKLIRAGFKVAICEQMENPEEAKKRGSKSVVRRDIVRTVTPGTLLEDGLLDAKSNNFLASVAVLRSGEEIAVSWIDLSTGEVFVRASAIDALVSDLAAISPTEIIIPDTGDDETTWEKALSAADFSAVMTRRPSHYFDSANGQRRMMDAYDVGAIEGLGDFSRAECASLGGLLAYVELTQAGRIPALQVPRKADRDAAMLIDAATRRSLELLQSRHGGRKGSLLWAVDRTVSGPGARALAARLSAPLTDVSAISKRFDAVDAFLADEQSRNDARASLKSSPDMARALSRLALERGGPRDIAAIRDGLAAARAIAAKLSESNSLSDFKHAIGDDIAALEDAKGEGFSELLRTLRSALVETPPLLARDGGFIEKGYDAGLDSVRILRDESRRLIAGLEAQYRERAGVKNLKIKNNNVLGYFVETPPSQADRLMAPPHDEFFIHRQTLASAVRFTTGELADMDAKITRARDEALAREQELFGDLCTIVMERRDAIANAAMALANIDAAAAMAALAAAEDYVRPHVDTSTAFEIAGGRHPVVEQSIRAGDDGFVANDCALNDGDKSLLCLMTGPNMAGKSTYLRQNAVIAILAQAGCFVPAAKAHIGVIDRVFSRVGASDDLARGQSTFMVEMVETAAILNQASERSLVVLDEIGRGTSTFDGLSIAWAALEHLHNINRCRGLFATHYHELTALASKLPRLFNMSMKVREWKDDVVFLHEVGSGPADRSYGVAVARLAGLPSSVVERAGAVLAMLETQREARAPIEDLPLFAAAPDTPVASSNAKVEPNESESVITKLRDLDLDALSPREALEVLYSLQREID